MVGSNKILGVTAALVLTGAIVAIIWQSRSRTDPPLPTGDWFYDLNTNQLFAGPTGAVPPIDAPSGPLPDGTPAGVRAHVFSCGDCSEPQRTVAWLETYSVEQRDVLRRPAAAGPGLDDKPYQAGPPPTFPARDQFPLTSGQLSMVRAPADADWLSKNSPEGQRVLSALMPRCPGKAAPAECRP